MAVVERTFQAPWGTLLKLMSFLGTLIIVGIPVVLFLTMHVTGIKLVLYCAFSVILLFITFLFIVKGYVIKGDVLRIRRLFWDTRIDLSSLLSAETDPDAMKKSIRIMGNGGLFSFSGKYRSSRLGSFRAFVTDYGNCVVLKLPEQTFVVSPENPEMFVEFLKNR